MKRETLMLRSAAHTRAQRATFLSTVMVTFFITQIYCHTNLVSISPITTRDA